jgi:hypothetical protein
MIFWKVVVVVVKGLVSRDGCFWMVCKSIWWTLSHEVYVFWMFEIFLDFLCGTDGFIL